MRASPDSWKGIPLSKPHPHRRSGPPGCATDRSAPTDSSRIAVDQVFDFIDGARLIFHF